jgi:hypothetical protein
MTELEPAPKLLSELPQLRGQLLSRPGNLKVGPVVEGATSARKLRECVLNASGDVVADAQHEVHAAQPAKHGAPRQLHEPVGVHVENDLRPRCKTAGQRDELAHVVQVDDVRVELPKAAQAVGGVSVCIEGHSLQLSMRCVEAAEYSRQTCVQVMPSPILADADAEVAHAVVYALSNVWVFPGADRHLEVSVGQLCELVRQVVHDPGDRAAQSGRRDGQIFLGKEADSHVFRGPIRTVAAVETRRNVAHLA